MNKPNPIWMRLKSGMILNLIDPSPHCWTNEDLAVRLARTYRWSSDTRWDRPLSVAQHSLTVLRLRECGTERPLTAAEQIRELLHDAEEGLFHFDSLSPMKQHLGAGYRLVVSRVRGAIDDRSDVPRWERASYEAHKRADRIAAASEAIHVVGWSGLEIRDFGVGSGYVQKVVTSPSRRGAAVGRAGLAGRPCRARTVRSVGCARGCRGWLRRPALA